MKSCILLGAGNSVTEGIEKGLWKKIKGREVWSLNSMFKIFPSFLLPTRQLWVDSTFFRHEAHNIQMLHKQGVTLHCKSHPKSYAFLGDMVHQYDVVREKEFFKDNKIAEVSHIFFGSHGLVGMFALSLAIKEGYNNIHLIGYDWGTKGIENRKTHCYQDKIEQLKIYSSGAGNPEIYLNKDNSTNKHIKDFEVYTREDVTIHNVSLKSNIPYFPKISWEEFFKKLENE